MELKARITATLLLFLLLAVPGFSIGRLHVKNMESEIYVIDYRGPETHTYIPPPNRAAGDGPKVHHNQTNMACHKSNVFKSKRNRKKIPGG